MSRLRAVVWSPERRGRCRARRQCLGVAGDGAGTEWGRGQIIHPRRPFNSAAGTRHCGARVRAALTCGMCPRVLRAALAAGGNMKITNRDFAEEDIDREVAAPVGDQKGRDFCRRQASCSGRSKCASYARHVCPEVLVDDLVLARRGANPRFDVRQDVGNGRSAGTVVPRPGRFLSYDCRLGRRPAGVKGSRMVGAAMESILRPQRRCLCHMDWGADVSSVTRS
jgi:hypothetical protein